MLWSCRVVNTMLDLLHELSLTLYSLVGLSVTLSVCLYVCMSVCLSVCSTGERMNGTLLAIPRSRLSAVQ